MTGNEHETGTRATILEEICARISAGESVNDVFRKPGEGYPGESTFWRWLDLDDALQKSYDVATRKRGEKYAEEIVQIADSARAPLILADGTPALDRDGHPVMVVDKVATEHARLRIDARKWVASKLIPKKYGDRTTIAGDAENPLAVVDQSTIARRLFPELAVTGAATTPGEPDAD